MTRQKKKWQFHYGFLESCSFVLGKTILSCRVTGSNFFFLNSFHARMKFTREREIYTRRFERGNVINPRNNRYSSRTMSVPTVTQKKVGCRRPLRTKLNVRTIIDIYVTYTKRLHREWCSDSRNEGLTKKEISITAQSSHTVETERVFDLESLYIRGIEKRKTSKVIQSRFQAAQPCECATQLYGCATYRQNCGPQ